MDGKFRSAVSEYLQILISGGENSVSRVNIGEKMHHSLRRAYNIIKPMFEEIILVDQNLFGTPSGVRTLLEMVLDENVRRDLEQKLQANEGDSKGVWDTFTKYFLQNRGQLSRKLNYIVEEVQLAMLYPRLDINVSKGMNHLLKAPFCVHPKTGKVCVPFNPSAAAKFDPTKVPNIR